MMSFYEFLASDLKKRSDIVFDHGNLIMEYWEDDQEYKLFSIEDFFVEVVNESATLNTVSISAMLAGKKLDAFLQRINLGVLIS